MRLVPDNSVDLILCDLPYGVTACEWDVTLPLGFLWEQYKRIIKDKGAIVLTAIQPFSSALIASNVKMFKYDLVWVKSRPTGHLSVHYRPMRAHEDILIFYKEAPTYNPPMIRVSDEEFERRKRQSAKKTNVDVGASVYAGQARVRYAKTDEALRHKYPNTLVHVKHKGKDIGLHVTQKPVGLFEYLIKMYTNEGDVVLDNCMGSGTTAIACLKTKRDYIGFELSEEYAKVTEERIAEFKKMEAC